MNPSVPAWASEVPLVILDERDFRATVNSIRLSMPDVSWSAICIGDTIIDCASGEILFRVEAD